MAGCKYHTQQQQQLGLNITLKGHRGPGDRQAAARQPVTDVREECADSVHSLQLNENELADMVPGPLRHPKETEAAAATV